MSLFRASTLCRLSPLPRLFVSVHHSCISWKKLSFFTSAPGKDSGVDSGRSIEQPPSALTDRRGNLRGVTSRDANSGSSYTDSANTGIGCLDQIAGRAWRASSRPPHSRANVHARGASSFLHRREIRVCLPALSPALLPAPSHTAPHSPLNNCPKMATTTEGPRVAEATPAAPEIFNEYE